MNVTIKLDDDLGKFARHMAVDEGISLSAWMAGLVKNVQQSQTKQNRMTPIEAYGDPATSDRDFIVPPLSGDIRDIDFS